ncbi:MAG TPA: 50S ribosomal protein L7/L12 [Candidatus Sumerlaeota bacterium]|jgi:large subunit ribosomal protein L7/L12|nr:50S ribosomal protein L7/L12 [Candidatus Sumerlaeota bacterium]HPR99996.1 50S ribosomal protein L7/L12 [Candidatus Sumerlaeota bacterium]
MANLTPQDVLEAVDSWTLLQINEFVEAFCEKYGVSASAPVAVAAAAAPAAAEAVEEKTEFTVTLTECGPEKIKVIKELRAINPSLGLKEAKDVADKVPSELVKDVSKAEAEEVVKKIEALGGKAVIK